MQRNNIAASAMQQPLLCKVRKVDNQLGIEKIDSIKDDHSKHLILLASGNRMDCIDVYAFLNGSRLILEAPLPFYFSDSPLRTHRIGKRRFEDYTINDPNIGFTEIILNPGFYYTVQSCHVLNPGLIKIVLSYKKMNNNKENHKRNQEVEQ
jgi:hypothetical protein